jgi:hypothetical protein
LERRLLIRRAAMQHKPHLPAKVAFGLVISVWPLIAVAGCSGRSHGAQVAAVRSGSTGDVLCGAADDGLAHPPPHFNEFIPPNKGASYVDPQYGCVVIRLTDAKAQFKIAIHHEYSTISAVNQNDSRVMLITEWWCDWLTIVPAQPSIIGRRAEPQSAGTAAT